MFGDASSTPINAVREGVTRRAMLQSSFACAALPLLAACRDGVSASAEAPASSSTQPVPVGPLTDASLTVTTQGAGAIGPDFAGLSFEKNTVQSQLFTGSNSDLIALFRRLGPSLLRVGGDTVDRNVWTPNGAGRTALQIAPADVDALADFLRATGWRCLYGVNLGGAGPHPYRGVAVTTPALAAAEVAYVAQRLGPALAGIEIGNETNFYGGRESYFAGDWSLSQFITLWKQFRESIVAATPRVTVTGPAAGGYHDPEASWTIPFGQAVTAKEISLLTQHHYRSYGGTTPTPQTLLTPDTDLVDVLGVLRDGAAGLGVPYRLAECNTPGPSGVANSYASALSTVDFLFTLAQNNCAGANFHGKTADYSPILITGDKVVEARPEYHGMLFFTLAGQGSLYRTQLSAGGLDVSAYAVTNPGTTTLVLVNKDSTHNLRLTAQLPHHAAAATLTTMTQRSPRATAPSLAATSGVTIQGSSVTPDGSFSPAAPYRLDTGGTRLTCYVPALSAVLVHAS